MRKKIELEDVNDDDDVAQVLVFSIHFSYFCEEQCGKRKFCSRFLRKRAFIRMNVAKSNENVNSAV